MRYFVTVVVGLLVTLAVTAQHRITGAVFNEKGQPLPFASAFLNQTTLGGRSTESGEFTIRQVPAGKYELIVSYLGYEPQLLPVEVNADVTGLKVTLRPKPGLLKEFVVKRNAERERWLKVFYSHFIGESTLAKQCRVLNSEVIDLEYDAGRQLLTASADDFVILENRALGYRVKFLLINFQYNMRSGYTLYYGNPLFEPMKAGNGRQQRQWEQNREAAYYGSTAHFYRSLIRRELAKDGFSVQKLVRKERTRDYVSPSPARQDSLGVKIQPPALFSRSVSYLYTAQLPYDSLYRPDGNGFSLIFRDHLYVVYSKEKEDRLYVAKHKPGQKTRPKEQVSVMSMLAPEVPLDVNGNIGSPVDIVVEQYWGWEKMAEMLPLDYKL